MIHPDYLSGSLEGCFRQILEQRMRGMPILNEALEVQSVGFQPWDGHVVGVLITPWFMNLMLLPIEGDSWSELSLGGRVDITFPAHSYPFSLNEIEGIGRCLTHSLYSPMFQFGDQAAAVATAEGILAGLFATTETTTPASGSIELERYLKKEGMFESEPKTTPETEAGPTLQERMEQPINRRELLFGLFRGSKEEG